MYKPLVGPFLGAVVLLTCPSFNRDHPLNAMQPAGVTGFYDYVPPGSALQANLIAEWRKHFIVEDGISSWTR
jgi:hypothetical protein